MTASRTARHAIAALALAAWGTHALVMWRVYGGGPHELLWACHVAPLLLALGCATGRVAITSIAATWATLGSPIWLGDLVAKGSAIGATPALVHLGVLALALVAVRIEGWDPRAWWRGTLLLYALAAVTRMVPAAERDDVNLVFRVWPGLEPYFPSFAAFVAFGVVMVPLSSYAVGLLLARLPRDQPGARAATDASRMRAT